MILQTQTASGWRAARVALRPVRFMQDGLYCAIRWTHV